MLITLTPMRRDDSLTLHRAGDVLTVNGTALDFGPLTEGSVLPRDAVECAFLASDVVRIDGRLRLSLILPHGPQAGPEALFPEPLVLDGDGPVALPGAQKAMSEPANAAQSTRSTRKAPLAQAEVPDDDH